MNLNKGHVDGHAHAGNDGFSNGEYVGGSYGRTELNGGRLVASIKDLGFLTHRSRINIAAVLTQILGRDREAASTDVIGTCYGQIDVAAAAHVDKPAAWVRL